MYLIDGGSPPLTPSPPFFFSSPGQELAMAGTSARDRRALQQHVNPVNVHAKHSDLTWPDLMVDAEGGSKSREINLNENSIQWSLVAVEVCVKSGGGKAVGRWGIVILVHPPNHMI